jgi:hyperpolarization activated cyclic nucleotide-gated potassium channel 2
MILFCLGYMTLLLPFRIAYDTGLDDGTFAVDDVLSWIMYIFFCIDIVLNFFTGLHRDGELITNHKQIACNYISFWFWIDFISIFPFEYVPPARQPTN